MVLLPLLMAVGACAPLLRGHAGDGVRLFIANDSWDAVDVSIDRDGRSELVGRVSVNEYRTFELPRAAGSADARFVVTAVSAVDGSFSTDTITGSRGSAVDIRLRRPIRHSRWWHY